MFDSDRCPLCKGPLAFHGISVRPVWAKWMWCLLDETYVACDEFGAIMLITKKIPATAYFVNFKEERQRKTA